MKLIDAVFHDEIDTVRTIIASGFDIDQADSKRNNALLVAVENDNMKIAKLLLENGANPNPTNIWTLPLVEAVDVAVQRTNYNADIQEDSTKMIELLLGFGADIDLKDHDGQSAYDIAYGYHIPAQKLFDVRRRK